MKGKNVFLSKNFIIICFVNFVLNMGQFMCNTLLPKYADFLGGSATIVGVVTSVFSVTSLVTKPFSGPAADFFEKKKLLLVGCGILVVTFCGYSFSETIGMLIVFRLFHGFSMGITVITCLAMVSDILPEEKITLGVAYFSVVQALATAVGPGLGLRMADAFGYQITFLSWLAMLLVCVVLILFLKVPAKGEKREFKISFKSCVAAEALPLAMIMMCLAAAYVTISSFLVLYAEDMGVEGIDIYFTVYAIVMLVCRPLIGKLTEKFGGAKTLPLTIILFAIGMVLIGLSRNLGMFILSAFFIAFGYGASHPLIHALCMQSVPPSRRGSASATGYYGTDIGYLISPLISGRLVDSVGYGNMFCFMALFPVLGFGLFCLFRGRIAKIHASVKQKSPS